MLSEDELGKLIVESGFTWSDGFLRDTKTVQELVFAIYPKLIESE